MIETLLYSVSEVAASTLQPRTTHTSGGQTTTLQLSDVTQWHDDQDLDVHHDGGGGEDGEDGEQGDGD